jgi:hypothetical protein
VGSTFVPTPIKPPGTANFRSLLSVYRLTILEKIGRHFIRPSESFEITPGLISISSLSFKTPQSIEPPATPPFKSLISEPGLLTSNERITMSFGKAEKSLI